MVTLVWFRRDLRLEDNPALAAALARRMPVVPVYVHDEAEGDGWPQGGASRWWLQGSLESLADSLAAKGSRLTLRRGSTPSVVDALIAETGADAIYWNRRYEPWAIRRDAQLKAALNERGVQARSFNANLLKEPWELSTQKGDPYRVFTPFRNALRQDGPPAQPFPSPRQVPAPPEFPAGDDLSSWGLRPAKPDWAGGLRRTWKPGEAGARDRLDAFLESALFAYRELRNVPAAAGSSRLSPHLHFGEIGPRQIWHAVTARGLAETGVVPQGVDTFLSELVWREFCHHLLFHFPSLPDEPLRPEFKRFAWAEETGLRAWRHGLTGFPIVDAGMRELWTTGWMHNRVRMVVASFLIKDLLLHWRIGETWFWDTLVDADLASNAANWQWVAGCGADAAPYFRVFNPTLQGEKFDPDGAYVRRWVPELANLPNVLIHAPWRARPVDLADAGVRLGRDYPAPIVDHANARRRALDAFKAMTDR